MSHLSVLMAALSFVGAAGTLGGAAVVLVRERRLSRVTAKCLTATSKPDREHALEVLRTLTQSAGRDEETRPPRLPRQRRTKEPPAGTPDQQQPEPAGPEASTAL